VVAAAMGDVGGVGCARTGVGERRKRRKRWNEEGARGVDDRNERTRTAEAEGERLL